MSVQTAPLDEICVRLKECNERTLALLALPPIKHDMSLPLPQRLAAFERLQSERVAEKISIMSEALAALKDMEALILPRNRCPNCKSAKVSGLVSSFWAPLDQGGELNDHLLREAVSAAELSELRQCDECNHNWNIYD